MKRSYPSNSSIFRRILIFLIPFLILLTLAFLQIFNLMILSADEFKTQADSNRILKERVFPPRGLILDRNEEIVVENFIRQDLKVTPSFVEDYSLYISNLSELLNYETSKIEDIFYKKLNEIKPFQSFTLIRNLNDEQIAKLNLNLSKFSGTEVIPNFSRNVTEGESLGSVVGYLGFASKNSMLQDPNLKNFSDQQIGLLGIEKEYDDFLRGEIGYKFLEKDSKGNVIKVLSTEPPKKGKNLKLSIDLELQRTLFKEFTGKKGALIAIEPETGFIRALISSPSYDPNYLNNFYSEEIEKILQDENSPLFNRAVSGQYPPASTLKPFIGLAALEEQVITWDEKIHDQGEFFVEGDDRPYRGWKEEGHGFVNMESAIAESSDVYFYNIAFDLTVSSISPFLAKFGFGSSSKLLGNESKGILPDKKWKLGQKGEFWFKGDTINMGIGQGYILTTPLQIAIAYSALVNGGQLITPRIVESIDGVATEFSSKRIELKNNDNWELIKKALVSVVESNKGTAHNLFDPKKRIAGKTGTAQVKRISKRERELDLELEQIPYKDRDHALYVAYGPYKNPRYALSIIVEHGGSGSKAAAPMAKELFKLIIDRDELRDKQSNFENINI